MSGILFPKQLCYIESFLKKQDELISALEVFAKKNRVPILDPVSACFLEQMIMMLKPKRALEIGVAIGYSSIRIARKLKTGAKLTAIEKSAPNFKLASVNFKEAGVEDKIEFLFGDALDLIPKIKNKYDFIFLDADKEDYKELFNLSLAKLNKNGVIFIDNLMWYGYAAKKAVPKKFKNSTRHIREFNEYFMNCELLTTTLLPMGDGIGIGVKK
jgi:predicted O-methyltransferase YrrM